jgi:RND family efflux transporter MFP subunit
LTHVTLSDRIDRMMKNQLRKTEPLLALLGLAAFLVACQQAPSAPEIPPPPVVVATAETRDVTLTREFTGNTVGFETVEIQARVSGYLESIDFEPSTMVKKGQRLFVIEPAPYEAVRDRAEASLKSAEAGLRRAESDLERLEQAVKTNAVSQQEVTRARAERDQAEASLLGSQAALRDAEIQLAYTSVTSPITGIIGRNLVDQGNLVGPGGTTLLARVIRVDPIFAYFDVDERTVVQTLQQLGGIDAERRTESDGVRDRLELVLEGVETTFEGRADYIDNQVDADTGTIQVRGVFPNPDLVLLPGFFVRVRVPVGQQPGALVVPETALSTDLGGRYLLVVGDDDVVEKRYVEPGSLRDDGMRVVLDGVDASDRFITRGVLKARPGLPVTSLTADEYEAAQQQQQRPQGA